MSIMKLAWTWRQPVIPRGSAGPERMRGRIIVGMLTGGDATETIQNGVAGGRDDGKK